MTVDFDVLGIGCASVDDFLYVDAYPAPDEKTPIRCTERQCGGLTATALAAASRMGARCAYAGVLGRDELSEFVCHALQNEHIDLRLAPRVDGARPIHSTIVVGSGGQTRNIFYDAGGLCGAHDAKPDAVSIRSSRVLFVDHWGIPGAIRACKIARESGVCVVADLERDDMSGFSTLLGLVDHLIVSEAFALKITGMAHPMAAVDALWNEERTLVAVTVGGEGCWYRSSGDAKPAHLPAFSVDVIDSTGCGDVFHGAYAAALAGGMAASERIRFASAAAAIKATKRGGQLGIPDRNAVEAFLRENR